MTGFGRGLAASALVGMCAALMSGAFGCELISTVDRSLITDGSGGSSSSSSSASSSSGGPECTAPADCPDPGNECLTRTCDSGKCVNAPVATGTPLAAQTAGDCKVMQCDGAGMAVAANADTDVSDDKKACTNDVCTAGTASNPPSPAGTSCGAALVCDGKGDCVGCAAATDCPGTDDECQARTCTAGVCGTSFTAAATPTTAQTTGDCKQNQCDGTGGVIAAVLATDIPVDANQCTDDICTGNLPSNPNTMSGGVCTTGGTVCNGAGACVTCLSAATCPAAANECQVATCMAGACGIAFVAVGTNAATQTTGDCHVNKCDGAGAISNVVEDTDLPNDSNPCTNDVCTAGVVSNPPAPSGTTCGGTQVCNATGGCVGCVTAATCPGTDTECQTRTCNTGVCGVSFATAGTPTAAQTAGDCKQNTCNGAGAIVPANDNVDVPVDSNQCTTDVCTAGSPSNPPTTSGSACSQMGGTLCNGNSACVQCLAASTCPGTDTDCKVRTCSPVGVCGFANTASGTVTTAQTTGDCQQGQCDGNGAVMSVAQNLDVPVDANQCTDNVCTAGVPSNPNSASGAVCSQSGGAVCSGTGTCVECVTGAQCTSGVCTGNACQMPSCTDNVKNGTETDLDCGGSTCGPCALTKVCTTAGDCTSGACTGNVCSLVNGCDLSTATVLTGGAPTTVLFSNFSYAPKCIKVTTGTVVTFDGDFTTHPLQGGEVVAGTKVPATSGPFMTLTSTGSSTPFTMSTAGTFPYYCDPHALGGMTGAVFVVQ
jgi:plastocyanin